ncbi:MAG: cyclohexa-1,5-dienecarbonyl-CoA hydratase [Rhodospirillales bacterium]|nr:cyclohexa-1,5-dienecarbonyl-CoA hydratase [Rhodospirillales bacterium]
MSEVTGEAITHGVHEAEPVAGPLEVWTERDGKLLRLRLNRPRANLIDAEMLAALQAALAEHETNANLCAVLLDAEGTDFSFGASVEEHLPGQCGSMLRSLHGLVKAMLAFPAPILVAVNGQCLGGGLEVALAADLMFVAPGAKLGQPEMKLGVFAPAASCLLPERVGRARATDLLLSGRSIDGATAGAMGLAVEVGDDPEEAALHYVDQHLAGKSASSLRFAVEAARSGFKERVASGLDAVERLYLDGLMSTRDAVEGLNAFLEKRPAVWEHH